MHPIPKHMLHITYTDTTLISEELVHAFIYKGHGKPLTTMKTTPLTQRSPRSLYSSWEPHAHLLSAFLRFLVCWSHCEWPEGKFLVPWALLVTAALTYWTSEVGCSQKTSARMYMYVHTVVITLTITKHRHKICDIQLDTIKFWRHMYIHVTVKFAPMKISHHTVR